MSLLKSFDEIKKYVPVNVTTDIESIEPDIAWAEEEYIKKYLGTLQYDELHAAYNSDSLLTTSLSYLLEKVQYALSNLAYAKYLAIGQLSIDNSGIRITVDGQKKQAFQWQVDGVERYFLSKGFSGLEWLLFFLEENADSYPLWKNSPAYTINKEHFINSAWDFSNHYTIHGHRHTFLALLPVMRKVEELTFLDVLGEDFFDEIKLEISTYSVSSDTNKVLRYLKPALAHLTIAKAIPELALEIDGQGVRINEVAAANGNSNTKKAAPDNLLSMKMQSAYNDGQAYLNRMITYLKQNASETKYATYYQKIVVPAQNTNSNLTFNKQNGGIYGAF